MITREGYDCFFLLCLILIRNYSKNDLFDFFYFYCLSASLAYSFVYNLKQNSLLHLNSRMTITINETKTDPPAAIPTITPVSNVSFYLSQYIFVLVSIGSL